MKISKTKVHLSMLIPFLMVFLVIFFYVLESVPVQNIAVEFFEIFFATAPLWIVSVVICLIIELATINDKLNKKRLRRMLIIETIVASIISLHMIFVILVIGSISNILRYQFLVYQKRSIKPVQTYNYENQ